MSHKRHSRAGCADQPRNNPYKAVPTLTESQAAAFWARVWKDPKTGCWIWQGPSRKGGRNLYGIVFIQGEAFLAHRVSYTLERGAIPDDLTLDHLRERGVCSTTLCGNPDHLEPVTRAENSRRMQEPRLQPTCKWGHPRENGKPCKGCNVMNVASTMKKNPDKYREMRRLQKQKERARQRQRQTEAA